MGGIASKYYEYPLIIIIFIEYFKNAQAMDFFFFWCGSGHNLRRYLLARGCWVERMPDNGSSGFLARARVLSMDH